MTTRTPPVPERMDTELWLAGCELSSAAERFMSLAGREHSINPVRLDEAQYVADCLKSFVVAQRKKEAA